ncbi:hypothetical protein [Streptomyces bambusae]|uniref:hypothetical protein n=1 Tax=Streptomyces bambusae TaxID=1550616 RepID=UPI0035567ED4
MTTRAGGLGLPIPQLRAGSFFPGWEGARRDRFRRCARSGWNRPGSGVRLRHVPALSEPLRRRRGGAGVRRGSRTPRRPAGGLGGGSGTRPRWSPPDPSSPRPCPARSPALTGRPLFGCARRAGRGLGTSPWCPVLVPRCTAVLFDGVVRSLHRGLLPRRCGGLPGRTGARTGSRGCGGGRPIPAERYVRP